MPPEGVVAEEVVAAVVPEANRPAPGASSSLAVTTAANSIASSPSSLPAVVGGVLHQPFRHCKDEF